MAAFPETDNAGGGFGGRAPAAQDIPEEYRGHLGRVSLKQTVPQLKAFAEAGGVIVAFGGSAVLGHHLGLPVSDHLVEVAQDGTERPLPGTKYYIPGGVLQVAVDNTNPTAFGFEKKVDVFFDNSPVMELAPDAAMHGIKTVAWFDNKSPLRSGWAWGQHYLLGGTAAIEATVGKGKVFLFGPEITFRAQPHGTFKFLFNSIFYGTSVTALPGAAHHDARRSRRGMSVEQLFSLGDGAGHGRLVPAGLRAQAAAARLAAGVVIPLLLSAGYLALIALHFQGTEGGFGSLAEVQTLFQKPELLLAGWIHYLAFDLFIGAWEVRDAQRHQIPHLVVIPCLVMTFMLGPIGLLFYFAIRTAKTKRMEMAGA